MDTEEKTTILGEDLPTSTDDPIRPDTEGAAAEQAPAAPEPKETDKTPDSASEDCTELPQETELPDGTRIITIPKGYEKYADGWYPRNPVRRFMERWGSFLNLGLIVVLVLFAVLHSRPVILVQSPTESPAPTQATEPAQTVPEPGPQPTLPPISEPVQTECFRISDGILEFLPEKFIQTPILQIPAELDGQAVRSIPDGTFENLTGVTTVLIPEGVLRVGARAFAGCTDLRGVVLPNSLSRIGKDAFRGCIRMQGIYVPGTVTAIGEGAFDDCPALYYIFFNGRYNSWTKLYSTYITPFTFILCLDGEFSHAAMLPTD